MLSLDEPLPATLPVELLQQIATEAQFYAADTDELRSAQNLRRLGSLVCNNRSRHVPWSNTSLALYDLQMRLAPYCGHVSFDASGTVDLREQVPDSVRNYFYYELIDVFPDTLSNHLQVWLKKWTDVAEGEVYYPWDRPLPAVTSGGAHVVQDVHRRAMQPLIHSSEARKLSDMFARDIMARRSLWSLTYLLHFDVGMVVTLFAYPREERKLRAWQLDSRYYHVQRLLTPFADGRATQSEYDAALQIVIEAHCSALEPTTVGRWRHNQHGVCNMRYDNTPELLVY